ncbi:MAG: hypothetical protein DHS80DRAFT_30147 [Piptocephalis tieghemiana]|nr:MAG: hypothetical protein DHS80DRAFT_30147 [Piptocephalis tieghemiana]
MSLDILLPPKPWYLDSRIVFLGISILYLYIYYLRHRAGMVQAADGPPEAEICPWWWRVPWRQIVGNYAVDAPKHEPAAEKTDSIKDSPPASEEAFAEGKIKIKTRRHPRSKPPSETMEMSKPSKRLGEEEVRQAAMNEYLRRQWTAEREEAKVPLERPLQPHRVPQSTRSAPKEKGTKVALVDLMAEGKGQEVFHQMDSALLEAILGGKSKVKPLGEDVIKSRASKSHPGRRREASRRHSSSEAQNRGMIHGSPLPVDRPLPDPSYFSHESSRRNKLFRPTGTQDTGNLLEGSIRPPYSSEDSGPIHRRIDTPREASGMEHQSMRTQRQQRWLEEMHSGMDVSDAGDTHQRAIRPASTTNDARDWRQNGSRINPWSGSSRPQSPSVTSEPTRSQAYHHASWPLTPPPPSSRSAEREQREESQKRPMGSRCDTASFYTAREDPEDHRVRVRGGPRPVPSPPEDSLLHAPLRRAHRERIQVAGRTRVPRNLMTSRTFFFGGN